MQMQTAPLDSVTQFAGVVGGKNDKGGQCARTVPISGMVTWKSARTSSRRASKPPPTCRLRPQADAAAGLFHRLQKWWRLKELSREKPVLERIQLIKRCGEAYPRDLPVGQLFFRIWVYTNRFPISTRRGPCYRQASSHCSATIENQARRDRSAKSVFPTPAGPTIITGLRRW